MNYVIKKVLNSSVVLVSDHENNEFILLGKWIGYGKKVGESIDQSASNQDEEGKQTMRALARNMTFLMKSIALGKEAYGLPEKEIRKGTNFIR